MDACVTLSEFKSLLGRGFGPLVIDARRKEAYAESSGVIPGAIRRDPATIATWWGRVPWGGVGVPVLGRVRG